MIAEVFRHEWKSLFEDRSALCVILLFLALSAYGIYNGKLWAERINAANSATVAEKEETLRSFQEELAQTKNDSAKKELDEKNDPFLAGQKGYMATMPPTGLSALAVGQSDLLPTTYFASIMSRQRTIGDKYGFENPVSLLTGRFDLAFVIIYLFPLLILALTYNIISGEKENGTLQLLLSQPISLSQIVLGKTLQRATLLIGLAILVSILGAIAGGANFADSQTFWRLGLWLPTLIIYGGFWFCAAVFINAFGKTSAANAVALIGIWIALVLIVPTLLNITVTQLYPTPSRTELMTAIRENIKDFRRDGNNMLAKYYEDHPELRPEGEETEDFGETFLLVQMDLDNQTAPIEKRFETQLAKQQALVDRAKFVSPAVATQTALNDLAGNGAARFSNFKQQSETFAENWENFFSSRVFRKTLLTVPDYAEIPRFRFVEETTSELAKRVVVSLLAILLPSAILFVFSVVLLRRYPITN